MKNAAKPSGIKAVCWPAGPWYWLYVCGTEITLPGSAPPWMYVLVRSRPNPESVLRRPFRSRLRRSISASSALYGTRTAFRSKCGFGPFAKWYTYS
jgi:hypothetical protein